MNDFLIPHRVNLFHRANPVAKLICMIALFMLTLFTHRLDFIFYQMTCFLLLLVFFSGHRLWKISIIITPFLIVFLASSSTMILFGKGDTIWWAWGLIQISQESFYRGIHIGFKAVTFASEGLLFVLTTPSVALFYALMQKAKLSPKFAYSFMASIRLLPMVWEELQIRRNALKIRGARSLRGGMKWIGGLKLYIVPLLVQGIRRAHRVAVAMETKAFDGKGRRSYYYPSEYSRNDCWVVLLLCAAVGAALLMSVFLPPFGVADVRYQL